MIKMLAVKGFAPGLKAVCGKAGGYVYHPGMNYTQESQCHGTGFHCAENPLDCLAFYSWDGKNEFWLVDAGGDIDDEDTMISCTELNIIRRLTLEEFLMLSLRYMVKYPRRVLSQYCDRGTAVAKSGYAIVRGVKPVAKGSKVGDLLAIAQDGPHMTVARVALLHVDGKKLVPNTWYDVNGKEVRM